ncbi:MAG: hypothetical protein QF437_20895 [Planctomycetota bacterium]|jgi:hypothetical protein|nr:hypothetical protein [Planctomycetota bacterium]MDP7132966.1 hypothetical protein [Planctomycetota bacterium]MDP7255218.1 hypothetical protein [Planctomycetota bacterium]
MPQAGRMQPSHIRLNLQDLMVISLLMAVLYGLNKVLLLSIEDKLFYLLWLVFRILSGV